MRYFYLVLSLCLVVRVSLAQTTDTPADSVRKTTLTLAAIYSTNASYYGQTGAERLPYALTNATVKFPGGLWLSGSAYKLLNTGSGISAADATAGISFDFNSSETFTGSISYSRAFYPENSPLVQAANKNSVNAGLNYDWNWLTTGVSADYAFGEENDLFVSFSNSKSINLGSLFSEKDYVSLDPAVELVAGTRHFYETYITKKNARDRLLEKITDPLAPPGKGNKNTTTISSYSFDLLTYNLKLPLSYNRSRYMVEAAYQLSILGQKVETTFSHPASFFNLSFYYQF